MTPMTVIYTTTAFVCPWCVRAKELLRIYGIDFYEKDINTSEQYKREFIEAGHKTVPQVYLETTLIGGYDATKKYARNKYFDKYFPTEGCSDAQRAINEKKRAEILVELEKVK